MIGTARDKDKKNIHMNPKKSNEIKEEHSNNPPRWPSGSTDLPGLGELQTNFYLPTDIEFKERSESSAGSSFLSADR